MDAALPSTSASSPVPVDNWAYEDSERGFRTRMKDQLLAPHCHHCGKLSTPEKKLRVCAGCLCVYYCDQVCKNHDGERHDKVECKQYAGKGMKEKFETCKHDLTWRLGSIDDRLWLASTIGRIGAVRALIAEGGDVNRVGADGYAVLQQSTLPETAFLRSLNSTLGLCITGLLIEVADEISEKSVSLGCAALVSRTAFADEWSLGTGDAEATLRRLQQQQGSIEAADRTIQLS